MAGRRKADGSRGSGGRDLTYENVAEHVIQLHTHLPDLVLNKDHTLPMPTQRTRQGVLMFLDISGFTSLCERFSMSSKNGTDKLTKTLNGYLGALVEEILTFDGDVLKYAGDAILTFWPIENYKHMKPAVLHVIKCALSIQEKYGTWKTSVGVTLKVKIGISAGEIVFTFVGNEKFCHYVSLGRAVAAANAAEGFCESGDIVVSPTAICHVPQVPLIKIPREDNKHMLITGFEEDVDVDSLPVAPYIMKHTVGLAVVESPAPDSKNILEMVKEKDMFGEDLKNPCLSRTDTAPAETAIRFAPGCRVRKSIIEQTSAEVYQKLRLYVAVPVLRKMDDQQPIEYLSEMRQVTVVFMNLVTEEMPKNLQSRLLQDSFNIIFSCLVKMQGCLNKIFMFDKGCTFLAIFGLPGFKHENDCAHALECAHDMLNQLNKLKAILKTSIGVTTGSTFCGVVGNPQRREYTVIGRKVNMAARLMMHYPGIVTCDNETFHHSKLPKDAFEQQEQKQMKGLRDVGVIRMFLGCKGREVGITHVQEVQEFAYPLLGRTRELGIFTSEIEKIHLDPEKGTRTQLICFEGESGIGRTRILYTAMQEALEIGMKVMSCALTMHDVKLPYFVVRNLLIRLLDLDNVRTHHEREVKLLRMFQNPEIVDNLSLLNDLLKLKFPVPEKFSELDVRTRTGLIHNLLFQIVHEMCKRQQFVMFVVDDAHFMDDDSWEFLGDLGQDKNSLVVVTVRTSSIGAMQFGPKAHKALTYPTTVNIPLGGLSTQFMAPLACQLLDVIEIPQALDVLIRDKSQGVPRWCEQLLNDMVYDDILKMVPIAEKDTDNGDVFIAPSTEYLKIQSGRVLSASARRSNEKRQQHNICVIAPDKSLEVGMPDSIKGMIQTRIDRMEEIDQMVLKCGSILGIIIPRDLLNALMPPKTTQTQINEAIRHLSEQNIIECMWNPNSAKNIKNKALSTTNSTVGHQCFCKKTNVENKGTRPSLQDHSLAQCETLRFTSPNFQETAYEMMLESARQTLHIIAAESIENQPKLCYACGGTGFLMHMFNQNEQEKDQLMNWKDRTESLPKNLEDILESISVLSKTGHSFAFESSKPNNKPVSLEAPSNNKVKVKKKDSSKHDKKRRKSLLRNENSYQSHYRASISQQIAVTETSRRLSDGGGRRMSMMVGGNETDLLLPRTNGDSLKEEITEITMDHLPDVEFDTRECKCLEILSSSYPLLVRHWKAAGKIEKTIHFLLEAANSCAATFDNIQALVYLQEVRRILQMVKNNENPFEMAQDNEQDSNILDYVMSDWDNARLESLLGQALFHIGNVEEALPHFHKALTILGNPQPNSALRIKICTWREKWIANKNLLLPDLNSNKSQGAGVGLIMSHRLTEQAHILSHLFLDHMATNDEKKALLVALQQVNKAQRANETNELIIAYSCMIDVCVMKNWRDKGVQYQALAFEKCQRAVRSMKPENWVTVVLLYTSTLAMQLLWGRIPEAIESGLVAAQLAKRLHDNDLMMQTLPLLIQGLIMANKTRLCVELMQDFKRATSSDVVGQTQYINCCWDALLEIGFKFESLDKCVRITDSVQNNVCLKTETLSLFYLASNATLWYARKKSWSESLTWQDIAKANEPCRMNSFMAIRSCTKILEALLLHLAHNYHNKTPAVQCHSAKLRKAIKLKFKLLKKLCKTSEVFKPRYYHLKAYRQAIEHQLSSARKTLDKCIARAASIGNVLEADWASHTKMAWYEMDPKLTQGDRWVSYIMADEDRSHIYQRDDGELVKFAFPLPVNYRK